MTFQGTPYTEMPEELKKRRNCLNCEKLFTARSGVHKYCCANCKGQYKYKDGSTTTESQYKNISGNWNRYFDRLLGKGRRGVLSRQDLLKQLEHQKGLCALTGIPLTCQLETGVKFNNNASIDRIEAGGSYAPDNIQLVCAAVNGFRVNTSIDEFIWYCEQVTNYQKKEVKFVCHT